jgi:hypothetical protein
MHEPVAPAMVVVDAIRFTAVSKLCRGRLRQFWVM